MQINTYPTYQCQSVEEVKVATNNLEKAKIVTLFANDGGVMKEAKRFKGIYNVSNGELCNVASDNYNLVLHKEYIDTFADALDRLGLKFNMIIKPSFNKVYADISFPEKIHKFEKLDEEFMTGIRLVNSYNKTTGLGIMPRLTRLACANGMVLTRSELTYNVKHTSKMLQELEKFIEVRINNIINQYQDLQKWVSLSMKDSIEWMTITKIAEKLFIQANHREEVLKRLKISMITKRKKGKKTSFNYVQEKKKLKITRWDFYNAITAYISHGEHVTPFLEAYYQKRAERVLLTPLVILAK